MRTHTRKTEPQIVLQKYAEAVSSALDEYFPEDSKVDIIAEPGTYYMRSAGTVVACVIAKRRRDEKKANGIVKHGNLSHIIFKDPRVLRTSRE